MARGLTLSLSVRAYHRSYYRPDNLCLVVCGQVEQERLFSVLANVEAKIAKKPTPTPMQRPWCARTYTHARTNKQHLHVTFPRLTQRSCLGSRPSHR